ncbi:hypothetical protein SeGA_1348 [Salmonella enterica subsp. enterica serovar Gaminara str. A4-567]|nr:hypothetical protein SeGA_1348 [Salmonella enterica subsp. enterica serovar Gaminara str. A4-567]
MFYVKRKIIDLHNFVLRKIIDLHNFLALLKNKMCRRL